MGIVHDTRTFVIGATIEICQKLNAIIGRVNTRAASVKLNAVLISKKFGIKASFLEKKSFVYNIHKTAKKLRCIETS